MMQQQQPPIKMYSIPQLIDYAKQAGFENQDLATIVSIAQQEQGGPGTQTSDGLHYGPLQFDVQIHAAQLLQSWHQLFGNQPASPIQAAENPQVAFKTAFNELSSGSTYKMWETYTVPPGHNSYQDVLPYVESLIQRLGQGGQPPSTATSQFGLPLPSPSEIGGWLGSPIVSGNPIGSAIQATGRNIGSGIASGVTTAAGNIWKGFYGAVSESLQTIGIFILGLLFVFSGIMIANETARNAVISGTKRLAGAAV